MFCIHYLTNQESVLLNEPSIRSFRICSLYNNNEFQSSIQITFDQVNVDWQNNRSIDRVQCICFYQENNDFGRAGYIYKLQENDNLQSWYICPIFNKGAN